jgi:predicted RND superfamily exporter protein
VSGDGLLARALLAPLRHPRATVAVVLLLTVLAALGWRRVAFAPDLARLLPQDHPDVAIADRLDERARPARSLWVLLTGAVAADDDAIATRAAALRASPLVAEVAATTTELFGAGAGAAPLWGLGDAQLQELADAVSQSARQRAIASLREALADDPLAARELVVADPLGLRWILARGDLSARLGLRADRRHAVLGDGEAAAAVLRLRGVRDAYDADFSARLMAHVEQALVGADHACYGGYAVAAADQARIRADFERASTWSIVAIACYLCWAMRGLRLPLLVQVPAALSVAWAIPFGCALLGPLPTVAVAAVAVLTGLGVDFAIHYAARYREARQTLDHAAAIVDVQRRTAPELLIDMATTAATFVAVGFGQRGGLAAFGWLLALGLVGSVALTTTLLPALLAYAGERRDPERSWLAGLADRWCAHRAARPCAYGALALAAVVAVVVAGRGLPLTADGEVLRPAGDPVTAARGTVEARLGFALTPCVALWPVDRDPSPLWQSLHDLQAAGAVRFWTGLDRSDTEAGRAAVATFRRATAGFADAARDELAAAGFASAAFAPALAQLDARFAADPVAPPADVLRHGDVEHRVVAVWPMAGGGRAAFEALATALQQRAGQAVVVHGTPTLTQALEGMLRADLHRACAFAAVLAFAMVALWLRSLRKGLLALAPSALGLLATLALLELLGMPLTMVSFVAVPFVLGIGVDEGVHMVGHFRDGAAATGSTGVGVVRTSVGTALGFGALATAASPGLVQLGGLVAFGALASMAACLFVLAPLLATRGRAK